MMRYFALFLVVAVLGGQTPVASSPAPTEEVRRASALLFASFYKKLDPHTVLQAEHDALARYAHANLPSVPLNVSVTDASDVAASQFDAAIANHHTSPVDTAYVALKALTGAAHDRYTQFLTPQEYRTIDEVLDPTKIAGIGILMDTDDATKFVRAFFVVPNTPADRAGLKSGDLIESIDGASTRGWSVGDAHKKLVGKSGTNVVLAIAHPSEAPQSMTLTRAEVQPPTVYFTMLPSHVAYVYVATFGTATSREFRTAVARSEADGARAYVLDLRNNGGGIVGTALNVSSTFVASGPIVSIESNGGEIETLEADNSAIPSKPLAVLVNGYSASASEITAAAIAESGTGVLVGTRTFGKGVVQSVSVLPDGSAMKITTGRYFTPLNHDLNGRGITPGVIVEENRGAVFGTPDKDAQLAKAVALVLAKLPG
jgi:carboxyl-terminal processing protease